MCATLDKKICRKGSQVNSRFAFIAPYRELADIASSLSKELGDEWIIKTGDLSGGVDVARALVAEGVEIIISRGGTARAISEQLEIHVVEVEVSAFDLIRAIHSARDMSDKIGLVGFPNIIYGTKTLESVFDVHISEIMISRESEVPQAISNAVKEGIGVIIGDAVSVRIARQHGLHTVLVTSGKEAILAAFQKAKEIAMVRRKERIREEELKTILDFSHEGIVVSNAAGEISLINKAAEKMFGLTKSSAAGLLSDDVLPLLPIMDVKESGESRLEGICRFRNKIFAYNVVPVKTDEEVSGVIATVQDGRYLENMETKLRQELHLKGHVAYHSFNSIVTQSPQMYKVIEQAKAFAQADSTILITGETGTGKELMAQSIHNASKRRGSAFVAVNCAAIPENLLESELFGYEEGAFTGARKSGKKGLFELAHRGTLFLDEVGEIPMQLQANLLRVLQQKTILRVGGDRVIPIDVRIIAATHRDLQEAVLETTFRKDLYYRLNVLRISVPPLSERKSDIPLLVKNLTERIASRLELATVDFDEEVTRLFQEYSWEGNIREMENILERLIILKSGARVTRSELFELLPDFEVDRTPAGSESASLEKIEKDTVLRVLKANGFDKEKACKELGMSPTTLWRRLKRWGISI